MVITMFLLFTAVFALVVAMLPYRGQKMDWYNANCIFWGALSLFLAGTRLQL